MKVPDPLVLPGNSGSGEVVRVRGPGLGRGQGLGLRPEWRHQVHSIETSLRVCPLEWAQPPGHTPGGRELGAASPAPGPAHPGPVPAFQGRSAVWPGNWHCLVTGRWTGPGLCEFWELVHAGPPAASAGAQLFPETSGSGFGAQKEKAGPLSSHGAVRP